MIFKERPIYVIGKRYACKFSGYCASIIQHLRFLVKNLIQCLLSLRAYLHQLLKQDTQYITPTIICQYFFGIPRGIRTPTHGFGDRHAAVDTREILKMRNTFPTIFPSTLYTNFHSTGARKFVILFKLPPIQHEWF
jgi:hypothetical protein